MDTLRFSTTACFLLRCLVIPLPAGPNYSSVRMKESRKCTDLDVFTPLPSPLELDDNIVTSGRHSLQPGLCSRTRAVTGLASSRGEEEERSPLSFIHFTKVIIPACIAVRSSSLKSEGLRRTCSWWKRGAEIKDYSPQVWRVHSRTRHLPFEMLFLAEKGFNNTGSDGLKLIQKFKNVS